MKKVLEKHGVLKCIGALMDVIALILFITSAFVDGTNGDMIIKLIGVVLFVVGSLFITLKAENHRLGKSLLVFIITTVLLTWLFPYGYFQGSDFYDYEMSRIGFTDLSYAIYYAINFTMDKIVFLVVVAGFYGVLSITSGYQKLVEKTSEKFKNHPAVWTVITSIILFVITSLTTQSFIVILFIPFFVSVLSKMGMDKLTAFAATFGSAVVGILGCTYGTDSLISFNYYLGQELSVGLTYRFIIAITALVLYNFFLVMRVRKITKTTKKNTKNTSNEEDPYMIEKAKGKDVKMYPTVIVLALTVIMTLLGYISFTNDFNIDVFDKFHEWLTGLEIGEGFTIFKYILGSKADALGAFSFVFIISIVLLLASMLLAFLYKIDVDKYIESFYEGTKKMFKPLLLLISVYTIFGICYLSPVIPTIANWFLNLVDGFNPYMTSIMAFVTSLFQNDLGYTAYTIGGFLTSVYTNDISLVHTIFISMYGLIQVFMPTSALLVVGLSFMKVDYKDWLKYIWLFILGMLVILLVLFTVVAYI